MTKRIERRVAVSERALAQRINRKFATLDFEPPRMLKKTRGGRAWDTPGDYFILDQRRNFIDDHHVDVEELARELEVLAVWEYLAEEKGEK